VSSAYEGWHCIIITQRYSVCIVDKQWYQCKGRIHSLLKLHFYTFMSCIRIKIIFKLSLQNFVTSKNTVTSLMKMLKVSASCVHLGF
jgi:hypothetical protein